MHPLFLLAALTFALIIAFLVWNRISTGRHRSDNKTAGPGGPSDPMAGAAEGMRNPDELRASLDTAAASDLPQARTDTHT